MKMHILYEIKNHIVFIAIVQTIVVSLIQMANPKFEIEIVINSVIP